MDEEVARKLCHAWSMVFVISVAILSIIWGAVEETNLTSEYWMLFYPIAGVTVVFAIISLFWAIIYFGEWMEG